MCPRRLQGQSEMSKPVQQTTLLCFFYSGTVRLKWWRLQGGDDVFVRLCNVHLYVQINVYLICILYVDAHALTKIQKHENVF